MQNNDVVCIRTTIKKDVQVNATTTAETATCSYLTG